MNIDSLDFISLSFHENSNPPPNTIIEVKKNDETIRQIPTENQQKISKKIEENSLIDFYA